MIRVRNGYTLREYAPAQHRYEYQETATAAAHSWRLSTAEETISTLLPAIATTGTATVSIGGSSSDYRKCDYQRTITWRFEGEQTMHTLTAVKSPGYSYYRAFYDDQYVFALGTAATAMYFAIHGFESTTCIRSRCQNGVNYTYSEDFDILRGKVIELAGTVESSGDSTYTVTGGEV